MRCDLLLAGILASAISAQAQTITSVSTQQGVLGDTLLITAVTNSAFTEPVYSTMHRNGRVNGSLVSYSTAPNEYLFMFLLPEYEEPGEWMLHVNGEPAWQEPFVFVPNSYPQQMIWEDVMGVHIGPEHQWGGAHGIMDMVTDSQGNLYVCGIASHFAQIPPFQIGAQNAQKEAFVAKLAADGTPLWMKGMGGVDHQLFHALDLYQDSILFLAGEVIVGQNVITRFGTDTLEIRDHLTFLGSSGILMRLDTEGSLKWYAMQGGHGGQMSYDVLALPTGKVWITGSLGKSQTVEPVHVYSAGYADSISVVQQQTTEVSLFLAQYDLNGGVEWLKREHLVPIGRGMGKFLRMHQDGVLLLGHVSGTIQFEGSTCSAENFGSSTALIMRLQYDGSIDWCNTYGNGTGSNSPAFDAAGNIYMATSEFPGLQLRLLKIAPDGELIYNRQVHNARPNDQPTPVVATSDGALVIGYSDPPPAITPGWGRHPVLKKVDLEGNAIAAIWPTPWEHPGTGILNHLYFDPFSGRVISTGIVRSPAWFGEQEITLSGNNFKAWLAWSDNDLTTATSPIMSDVPNGIQLHPNPADASIFVTASGDLDGHVMDMLGRRVTDLKITAGGKATIDVANWSNGVYLLMDRERSVVNRFVVQH